jgi:hypothetical protein
MNSHSQSQRTRFPDAKDLGVRNYFNRDPVPNNPAAFHDNQSVRVSDDFFDIVSGNQDGVSDLVQ